MLKEKTSIHVLHTFEHSLTQTLGKPNQQKYGPETAATTQDAKILADATHHQNLLGWDTLLRGYISTYWHKCQPQPDPNEK